MNDSQKILSIIIENVKKNNITEKDCLLACGINTSFLTDWKNNKVKSPSYDKLVKIALFLNIDLYELFLGQKKSSLELTNEEQECIDKFNRLTDIDKGKIIERMDVMYSSYAPEVKENA